jgi:hypothetical protein
MPIIGTGIFGFGLMTCLCGQSRAIDVPTTDSTNSLPIILYLVDSFTYAASASSASTVFRKYVVPNLSLHLTILLFFSSFLGFLFPLFGTQMYHALGVGPGNSLLAGLAIVIGIPFPVWIWYKGEEIRSRNPLNR